MKNQLNVALLMTAVLAMTCALGAQAQDKQKPANQKQQSQSPSESLSSLPEPDVEAAGDKAKILLDKIEVLGSLSKPQAIFIIPGSDPQVDDIRIDRSFFADIFRPVEIDFFPQRGRRKFRTTIPW